MATVEFGTGKTIFVLTIVVGCFAVLWPKIFYPMLQASINPNTEAETTPECCDVIFESDVKAIQLMTAMCMAILSRSSIDDAQHRLLLNGQMSQEVADLCRQNVLDTCGLDITAVIREKVGLTKSYKEALVYARSFNSSICLRENFGVDLMSLGQPRRMRQRVEVPSHIRPERPPHIRPEIHPAMKEKGRAIISPRHSSDRTPPIPGMRPAMGGPGHVVPPPKGSGTMGVIMPMYTVGIVIFFVYTIMKVLFKRPEDRSPKLKDFGMDPEYRKYLCSEEYEDGSELSMKSQMRRREMHEKREMRAAYEEISKPKLDEENHISNNVVPISVSEITTNKPLSLEVETELELEDESKRLDIEPLQQGDIEIDQLRRRLEETEAAMERIVARMGSASDRLAPRMVADVLAESTMGAKVEEIKLSTENLQAAAQEEEKLSEAIDDDLDEELVTAPLDDPPRRLEVLGMETTAQGSGGPASPVRSRSTTPAPPNAAAIYLTGAPLASTSQLLVADMSQEEPSNYDTAPFVLSGKMTLSLIGGGSLGDPDATAPPSLSLNADDETPTASLDTAEDISPNQPFTSAAEPVLQSSFGEKEKLQELQSALQEEKERLSGSKASSPDMEEYDVLGNGFNGILPDSELHVAGEEAYTTASIAAEGGSGTEETAADISVLESLSEPLLANKVDDLPCDPPETQTQ